MSRRRVMDLFRLGAIAGVVQQFRPPQISDFGGGGIDSPLYINATTGEAFIFVGGNIVPFAWFGGINVMAFGAKGDGVTNDYPAITAAIAAAQAKGPGTPVFFPHGGPWAHATPINITGTPVRLVGTGMSVAAYAPLAATAGCVLKYIGPATASPAVAFTGVQSSHGMEHITVDANNLADIGFQVNSCTYGIHSDVSVRNARARQFVVRSTAATGPACAWNRFQQFALDTTGGASDIAAMWLTGDGTTDTCHNTFHGFRINHSGASNGIDLGYCDNNRFIGMYINRSGSGRGVNVIDSEHAGFPISNYFYHLQAGMGGWVQGALAPINYINGYDRANGQPAAVTNGSLLSIDDVVEVVWTPVGNNVTFAAAAGRCFRHGGRTVEAFFDVTFPVTADANQARLTGLPFPVANFNNAQSGAISFNNSGTTYGVAANINSTYCVFYDNAGNAPPNSGLSGKRFVGSAIYYTQ